jgi:hypothetical protein
LARGLWLGRQGQAGADMVNTGILVSIHRSMGLLHEAVRVIQSFPDTSTDIATVEAALRYLQKGDETQVCVICLRKNDEVLIHPQSDIDRNARHLLNDAAKFRHRDELISKTASYYDKMKNRKKGFLLVPLDDWWLRQDRLTAISYKTLDNLQWLVVTEAHFDVGDLKLIERQHLL